MHLEDLKKNLDKIEQLAINQVYYCNVFEYHENPLSESIFLNFSIEECIGCSPASHYQNREPI